jgi:2-keto-4-pentenoate hydratase
MSSETFDPAPAARRLARFWQGWQQLENLPEAERPRDLAEGYRVQRQLIAELSQPVAGYKVGLSSVAAMERSGLGEPLFGFAPQSRFHRSGATVQLPFKDGVTVEVEIGFVLAADPQAEPTARLMFEIVRSRFLRPREVDLPSFVGDSSGFCAMVAGDAIPMGELSALLERGADLSRGGEVVARALVGSECPDPLDVLRRFRLLATRYEMPIAAGMVIATGSVVAPLETHGPDVYAAQLGPYRASFVGVDRP